MLDEKIELPSQEELATLPRWAIVAYAARCARRVQPLFADSALPLSQVHDSAFLKVIHLVEQAASHPEDASGLIAADLSLADARERSHAGKAIGGSAATADSGFHRNKSQSIASAAYTAESSFLAAKLHVEEHVICQVIRSDFELLRGLAQREGWTDDSPVDVRLLGPLWPDGVPEGWPEDPATVPSPFPLAIDPGAADIETIREVMEALSDFHEAHTGYALTYRVDGSLILAHAEALR